MTRDSCSCTNAECARCDETPRNARDQLLADLPLSFDIGELTTMALAGDVEVRVVAVQRLAELARNFR